MGGGCSTMGSGFSSHTSHAPEQTTVTVKPKPVPQQYGRHAEEPPRTVALTRFWNSTTCGEMVKGQTPVTLNTDDTVLTASKLLDSKRISSAPVIDNKSQHPVAMFDYRDLTAFLIMANNHHLQQVAESGTFGVKPAVPPSTHGPDAKSEQSTQRTQTWQSSLPGTPAQEFSPRQPIERTHSPTPTTAIHTPAAHSPQASTGPRLSFASKTHNPLMLISAIKASTHAILDRSRTSSQEKQHPTEYMEPTSLMRMELHKYLHFLDLKDALTGMIANLSGANPIHLVNTVTPLYGAVQLMVGYNDVPVRGVIVMNKTQHMIGMVTQSACLRFMYEKLKSSTIEKTHPGLVDFMKGSLRDLGLCNRRAPTISWKATVIQAFQYMNEKKKQSLAIINDENGILVGTISVSDIKYLWNSKELLLTLQRPVSVFVNVIRQSATYWHVNLDSSSPATAMSTSYTTHTDQSLFDTIEMMLTKRIHRLWLINKQDKPVGMLSMTDILRVLMPPPIQSVKPKNDHTRTHSHAPHTTQTRSRQISAPHTLQRPHTTFEKNQPTDVPSKYVVHHHDDIEKEHDAISIRRKSDGWMKT